jgi:hypothetical protein
VIGGRRRAKGTADDAIRLRAGEAPEGGVRWDLVLVWYMRVLALVWIAKGLGAWAMILGAGEAMPGFEIRPTGHQATAIYFAVIDPIAGVGLWLTSVWGGVIWLLAVMSHLILSLFFPGVVPSNMVMTGFLVAFMALYLVLSWLSAGQEG